MPRHTPKRTAKPAAPARSILPSIVTGALEIGSQVGRAALSTAQDVLAGAARLVGGSSKLSESLAARPARPADPRLPEAALNAIVEARRRQRAETEARRPAGRKPLARSPSRTESTGARPRRPMRGRGRMGAGARRPR